MRIWERDANARKKRNTYPDDVIVCLGLFMSPFNWNERTLICCGFRDCVVAFVRSIWRRLHMQWPPVVNLIDERSWIEGTRITRIAIVSMRWLTWTWPIHNAIQKEKSNFFLHYINFQRDLTHVQLHNGRSLVRLSIPSCTKIFRSCIIFLFHTLKVCLDCLYAYVVRSNRYRHLCAAIPFSHAIFVVAIVAMFVQKI